jgi:transcriptional regulator with XRE-family HTH domain
VFQLRATSYLVYSGSMNAPVNANGPAIKAQRKAAGYRQEDLAEAVGISPSHLCRVETGERDTSQRVLTAISHTLRIPKDAITKQVA